MIFLADANIPRQVVDRLRSDGHTVFAIVEMNPEISDETVLAMANSENALLLTADTDFGELIFRESRSAVGVILLRLGSLSPILRGEIVAGVIEQHQEALFGSFTVITPGQIRIRRGV
ncbi:DUF5615 family PIN-like protein [Scytonema sp. NUACC26]|uniref:DUF5615 family PIN-like protein n=1 Tax=Scytonema sp. NUACC26 TaxID=3140176 RepID=UPI0034DC7AA0